MSNTTYANTQLGLVCTTAMCANAKVQVAQMHSTYEQYANDPAFAARFKPAVDSIQSAFDENYSVWSEWIPFNPACCALQDTGNDAEDITNKMISYVGGVTPDVTPAPFDWVTLAVIGGVLFIAAPYVTPFLRGRK